MAWVWSRLVRLASAGQRGLAVPTPAAMLLGAAGLGLALRWRTAASMPLAPPHPVLGLLLGLTEDVAIAALLVLVASLGRIAMGAAVGCLLSLAVLHIAWSEALIYFGHPPRCADIEAGTQGVFLVRTFDLQALLPPLVILVLAVGTVLLAWRVAVLRAARATVLGIGLGAALVAMAIRPAIPVPEYFRNPAFTALRLWRCAASNPVAAAPGTARPTLPATSIRELMPTVPATSFISPDYPLAYAPPPRGDAPRAPAGMRQNIVFILMEGVRAHEVGAWGGRFPGLTPNLDQLAAQGIRFARAYSPGTHTATSEIGDWFGTLAIPESILMRSWPEVPLSGLPDQLRANGWRSFLWMHNADTSIYKREQFYIPRGFQMIDERGFPADDPETNWGKSDKALMRRAVAAFDHLGEPFGAMLLTVSNHMPFQVPSDAVSHYPIPDGLQSDMLARFGRSSGRYGVAMLQTIHYTDEAVGAFFAAARTRPWFARTLFVVSGDHGLPLSPPEGVAGPHEMAELRHRVPLLMFAPWLQGGEVVDDPVSLADLPATILGLLEVPDVRCGPGIDVLAKGVAAASRPVIGWNDEARQLTIASHGWVYHATVGDPVPGIEHPIGDELLVATDPATAAAASSRLPMLERNRRWARVYLEVYPWLVTHGRATLPPTSSKTTRRPRRRQGRVSRRRRDSA